MEWREYVELEEDVELFKTFSNDPAHSCRVS
jgi:hypothetical protein